MKLYRIELHNFRGFECFSAEFNEQLTVLAGDNGAGKSTVLDAAAIAVGTFLLGFDGMSSVGITKEDAMKKSFELGSVVDLQPQFPVEIIAEGEVRKQPIRWVRTLNGQNGRTTVRDAQEMVGLAEQYQKEVRAGDPSVILPLISYYGTGRLWAQKKERKSDSLTQQFSRLMGYTDCLEAESNEKMMLKWFEKMTIQELQRKTELPELTAVRKAIAACFRDVAGTDEAEVVFDIATHRLEILYSEEGNRKRIPIKNLSDGYKNTLSMIADIAYRMAVLNPQLLDDVLEETPGIVLIDEIDLHLHPRWQQRILSDLRKIFPKLQFIVSTHAPSVVNSVSKENVLILKHFEQAEMPAVETYGSDVNSILNHIMEADERPALIKKMFKQFYEAMDAQDIKQGENILTKLKELVAEDDPEITAADMTLTLEKM